MCACRVDGARAWVGVGAGRWLAAEPASASQLLALRAYDGAASGTEFVVTTLLFGPPRVIETRMRAVSGTLGQQGLSGTLNVSTGSSGGVSEFNTTKLKAEYVDTHTNTHNFEVCSQATWGCMITLLSDTKGFAVGGRQFRVRPARAEPAALSGPSSRPACWRRKLPLSASQVWAELLPPTEAVGDACEVPPDDARTPFNESAIFATIGNASLGYLNYEACARAATPNLRRARSVPRVRSA